MELIKLSSVREVKYLFHVNKNFIENVEGLWIYYLKIDCSFGFYYKIGACRDIKKRVSSLKNIHGINSQVKDRNLILHDINIIAGEWVNSCKAAKNIEKKILYKYKEFKTKELVLWNGNSEIFNKDVLNLDSKEKLWRKRASNNLIII